MPGGSIELMLDVSALTIERARQKRG